MVLDTERTRLEHPEVWEREATLNLTEKIQLWINQPMFDALRAVSSQLRVPYSAIVRNAIHDYCSRYKIYQDTYLEKLDELTE